jgi:ribosomal protein L24E
MTGILNEQEEARTKINSSEEAHKLFDTNPGNSNEEINKAAKQYLRKWHTDRWRNYKTKKGTYCSDLKCGKAERAGEDIWFHSEGCKDRYKKCLINYLKGENARKFLLEGGGGGSGLNNNISVEKCDYCGSDYQWENGKPKNGYHDFKKFSTKSGEKPANWFCKESCFKSFFICYICEKNTTERKNLSEWSKKRGKNIYLCSSDCRKKFDDGDYTSGGGPETSTCHFCHKKYQQGNGIYFTDNPGMVFCSEECARSWEREFWDKKSLADQRANFIAESLEKLSGWDLLTNEEKQNFIRQVNSSEPKQFKNIYRQVKKLINEKQNSGEGNEDGNGLGDIPRNNNYDPIQNEEKDDSQDIPDLSLVQSQAQAEQKIKKLLKENDISEQELNQEKLLEGTDWKSYLKKIDTPQKVAEFTKKMQQAILRLKMTKKTSNQDKEPTNNWILPVSILAVSFLALTSLMLIVRKRRQRRF